MSIVLRYPFNEYLTGDVSANAHQSVAHSGVPLVQDSTLGTVAEFDGTATGFIKGPTLTVGPTRTVSYWTYIHTVQTSFVLFIGEWHAKAWGAYVLANSKAGLNVSGSFI